MQYYTFQTVNNYKNHFKKIEEELANLKKNKQHINKNPVKEIEKMLESEHNTYSNEEKALTDHDIKKEAMNLKRNNKRESNTDDLFPMFKENETITENHSKYIDP